MQILTFINILNAHLVPELHANFNFRQHLNAQLEPELHQAVNAT
jgi:hypothetical protein